MTREAAHEWAELLMFAQDSEVPDTMVMTALQYLHGFDMTFTPPQRSVTSHGPPGQYVRSTADIANEFSGWLANCEDYDRDPEGYRRRARARGRTVADAEQQRRLDQE